MVRMRGVAAVAGVLLAASAAWASDGAGVGVRGGPGMVVEAGPPAAVVSRPDVDIARDVRKAVLGYIHYGVFDSVEMSVDNGRVLLAGSVSRGYRKKDIEGLVARVPGVHEVRSLIRVQPASLFDDQLRWQIFRRIYDGDAMVPVASLVNPPVRIVVENGRVTLVGVVSSRVDQMKVGMVARETLAFRVNNQVEVESELRRREMPVSAVQPI